jgi:hypothetical protein
VKQNVYAAFIEGKFLAEFANVQVTAIILMTKCVKPYRILPPY